MQEHVIETLRDREPENEHKEIANNRKEIIDEAKKVELEDRIVFTNDDLEKVVKAMSVKSKECHHPIVKADEVYRSAMLMMYNKCCRAEKIPSSYTETTLTQLKKPKGAMFELGGYRFIHQKKCGPRVLEAN